MAYDVTSGNSDARNLADYREVRHTTTSEGGYDYPPNYFEPPLYEQLQDVAIHP